MSEHTELVKPRISLLAKCILVTGIIGMLWVPMLGIVGVLVLPHQWVVRTDKLHIAEFLIWLLSAVDILILATPTQTNKQLIIVVTIIVLGLLLLFKLLDSAQSNSWLVLAPAQKQRRNFGRCCICFRPIEDNKLVRCVHCNTVCHESHMREWDKFLGKCSNCLKENWVQLVRQPRRQR